MSLAASLDTGEFRAHCHYWCPPDEFADLAAALRTFPIRKESPIDERWYDGCIGLRIEPLDSVGHLSVSVALQEFSSDWNKCQSQFHVTYSDVDRFREQLERVLADGAGEATLSAS